MKETLLGVLFAVVIVIFAIIIVEWDSKYDKTHPQPEGQAEKAARVCEEKGGIYSPGGFAAGRCDFPPQ